jgi:hypothetical protein
MTLRRRFLTSVLWLAGTVIGLGEIELWFERVEMSNNLERVYFGRDIISESEWDAQSFDSGSARELKRVTLNLFRDPAVSPSGTFWVRLYAPTGVDGAPGTNALATIAQDQPIAALDSWFENTVTYWGLEIPLEVNSPYFIVVGADAGATGLLWGYTNDPVGANGFPSLFTFTGDGGVTWRTPFMNALPQRIRVVGDQDP